MHSGIESPVWEEAVKESSLALVSVPAGCLEQVCFFNPLACPSTSGPVTGPGLVLACSGQLRKSCISL